MKSYLYSVAIFYIIYIFYMINIIHIISMNHSHSYLPLLILFHFYFLYLCICAPTTTPMSYLSPYPLSSKGLCSHFHPYAAIHKTGNNLLQIAHFAVCIRPPLLLLPSSSNLRRRNPLQIWMTITVALTKTTRLQTYLPVHNMIPF